MYFSPLIAAAVLAVLPAGANAVVFARDNTTAPTGVDGNTTAWVTQTVTAYQTYCPSSTKVRLNPLGGQLLF